MQGKVEEAYKAADIRIFLPDCLVEVVEGEEDLTWAA